MFVESEQRELEKKENYIFCSFFIVSINITHSSPTSESLKSWVWVLAFTGGSVSLSVSLCCRYTGATAHHRRRKDGESDFSEEEPSLLLWQLFPTAHLSGLACSCTQWLMSSVNGRRLDRSKIGQIKPEGHKLCNSHLSKRLSLMVRERGQGTQRRELTRNAQILVLHLSVNCPVLNSTDLLTFPCIFQLCIFHLCNEQAKSDVPYLKLKRKSV